MDECQKGKKEHKYGNNESEGANSSLGTISWCATTWRKFPPHLSWRMALESDSFPSIGEPKVTQITEKEEGSDWRHERNHRAEREATVPPTEWPVNTTDLLLLVISLICMCAKWREYKMLLA